MSTVRSVRIAAASGVGALVLLVGGFLVGGSLVSAQTPEPSTPQTQPSDPGAAPRGDKKCDEGQNSSSATGVRFRGGGSLRQ